MTGPSRAESNRGRPGSVSMPSGSPRTASAAGGSAERVTDSSQPASGRVALRQRNAPLKFGAAALGGADPHRPAQLAGPVSEVAEPAAPIQGLHPGAVVPDGKRQIRVGPD